MDSLSMCRDTRGSSSDTWMPATLVGDGLEPAVGLGIPGVHLARSALQPEENAGLGLCLPRRPRLGHQVLQGQVLAQVEAQQTERADPQEMAPPKILPGALQAA